MNIDHQISPPERFPTPLTAHNFPLLLTAARIHYESWTSFSGPTPLHFGFPLLNGLRPPLNPNDLFSSYKLPYSPPEMTEGSMTFPF